MYRHLVVIRSDGWEDTLCQATGSPETFTRNYKKPKCPDCLKRMEEGN